MLAIANIAIPVSDQARAKEFYLRIGFEILAEEQMKDNTRWIQMGLPGAQTSISLVTWFKSMQPGAMQGVVLVTDDIRSEFASLKGQGLNISELTETKNGMFFTIKDPDGNSISVQQH